MLRQLNLNDLEKCKWCNIQLNRISKIAFLFSKVEVLGNGKLEVQGGDGNKGTSSGGEGGGAGGIIQIISLVGNLSSGSLSLGLGTSSNDVNCNQEQEKNDHHGFYYLQGIST